MKEEWLERNHMDLDYLNNGWCSDRTKYHLEGSPDGWYVEVGTAETMSAIANVLDADLAGLDVVELDISVVTGPRREVTCRIADWIYGVQLFDGSLPVGIVYPSRHGTHEGTCYATWLRRIDDGYPPSSEMTRILDSFPILPDDPDLKVIVQMFGIRTFS